MKTEQFEQALKRGDFALCDMLCIYGLEFEVIYDRGSKPDNNLFSNFCKEVTV